jgi:hypothetical protein
LGSPEQNQEKFRVLTVASMKMTVFWDVAPCSLVETDRHFRGTNCLHHQGDVLHGATSHKTFSSASGELPPYKRPRYPVKI